jgi:hypothetical protein
MVPNLEDLDNGLRELGETETVVWHHSANPKSFGPDFGGQAHAQRLAAAPLPLQNTLVAKVRTGPFRVNYGALKTLQWLASFSTI